MPTGADALPGAARCVIVGGGVGGASIAYHLARLGWRDVVVVEQHDLTEGTTWHSAGFVGQLRSTIGQTRMIMYSSGLYRELREVTGRDPGWREVGGLRLATTRERMEELQRQASAAETYGLRLDLLSPAEAHDRLPLLAVGDVLGAAWLPGDGYLDPALLALALADGARAHGVAFHTHTRVTGLDVRGGRVAAVETDRGTIRTDTVVNAAGAAAGRLARMAGVVVPVVPMRHQYVVSEPLDPPVGEVPTVRDPDHIAYFRPEAGALLVGGYARDPAPWDDADPLAAPRTLAEPDRERFAEAWDGARRRVPALADAAIAKVVNGPEAFTPDGEFILGETDVDGFWVAAGFCVHGLAGAGGVGKVMAEWIAGGVPDFDVSRMDVRRFGAHFRSARHARVRALDAYSRYYDVVYPDEERDAGRPLRVSAAYERLRALGAAFGEKAGWERANWFEANAPEGREALRPGGWAGRFWSPAIDAECRATRDAAALFDQSSFAKLDVHGPGAAAALGRLCANDVDREPGTAVYTQLLNDRGGIEADLTVTRVSEDRFRVVTGTASGGRDLAWIRRRLPPDVHAEDVTGARACLCLWGPLAREILEPLCDDDLTFGFLRAREIAVGAVPVFAQRITFVGEPGWELYCPAEYGQALWDAIWAAGRSHGLRAGGYRAIDSMRLEKGHRVWGADITPETTPDAAGLGFAVRMDKPGGFIGRDALAEARASGGPDARLRCLVLDEPRAVCLGDEPVRVDGAPAGRVTSGGFGHRVERSIAYAYLPPPVEPGARVEVGVFGRWIGADVVREPLYDPDGERVGG
ncbi:MAG TPA: FAD-dependent oxidoreductase [Solirubrobacteraceae bacterium]|nr:FAD-dependent oxidoreductase [Solirubrobacteraceae bacterium]